MVEIRYPSCKTKRGNVQWGGTSSFSAFSWQTKISPCLRVFFALIRPSSRLRARALIVTVSSFDFSLTPSLDYVTVSHPQRKVHYLWYEKTKIVRFRYTEIIDPNNRLASARASLSVFRCRNYLVIGIFVFLVELLGNPNRQFRFFQICCNCLC